MHDENAVGLVETYYTVSVNLTVALTLTLKPKPLKQKFGKF